MKNPHEENHCSVPTSLLNSTQVAMPETVKIQIPSLKLIRSLGLTILGLLCLSTIGQIFKHVFNRTRLLGLTRLFWVDAEANIPSLYSTTTLLFCSFLLAMIAITKQQQHDRLTKHWQILAVIFLFLSIDEAVSLHELATDPLRALLQAEGVLFFTWIIPGIVLVLVFVMNYLKFLQKLPDKTRNLFVLAGSIYISGAIGSEMIAAWFSSTGQQETLYYVFTSTLEEGLEMLGILIFIYALLSYLHTYVGAIALQIHFQKK